jgi:hypothetical protein
MSLGYVDMPLQRDFIKCIIIARRALRFMSFDSLHTSDCFDRSIEGLQITLDIVLCIASYPMLSS